MLHLTGTNTTMRKKEIQSLTLYLKNWKIAFPTLNTTKTILKVRWQKS